MQKITSVPKAPEYYNGVINLRGEVVPVMSAHRKMGLGEDVITKVQDHYLKLEVQGLVGIQVDEVREVVTLGESEIERSAQNKKNANYIYQRNR